MTGNVLLSWDSSPDRQAWSAELLSSVAEHLAELELGNPEQFVGGYSSLTDAAKFRYWGELVIAMAKFESGWKPNVIFHEPPPLGVDSVGLLQLSYEDQPIYKLEPLDRTKKSLEDPLVNLRCGVKILATLLARDRVVAASEGAKHGGAARYWSVLRAGPKHHLGEIQALVRKNAVL